MIYDGGIAFYNAVHSKVTSVPSVGNLSVFERLDGNLNSV